MIMFSRANLLFCFFFKNDINKGTEQNRFIVPKISNIMAGKDKIIQ